MNDTDQEEINVVADPRNNATLIASFHVFYTDAKIFVKYLLDKKDTRVF